MALALSRCQMVSLVAVGVVLFLVFMRPTVFIQEGFRRVRFNPVKQYIPYPEDHPYSRIPCSKRDFECVKWSDCKGFYGDKQCVAFKKKANSKCVGGYEWIGNEQQQRRVCNSVRGDGNGIDCMGHTSDYEVLHHSDAGPECRPIRWGLNPPRVHGEDNRTLMPPVSATLSKINF